MQISEKILNFIKNKLITYNEASGQFKVMIL